MKVYEKWNELVSDENNQEFFQKYLETEKGVYEKILSEKTDVIEGTVDEISKTYDIELATLGGFLDGINTSLKTPLELEDITEESQIKLEIDFEKLFYNMIGAKADWLYSIEAWDDILSTEQMVAIKKLYNTDHIAKSTKVGRNEPCPCGSGKKFKKCCGK